MGTVTLFLGESTVRIKAEVDEMSHLNLRRGASVREYARQAEIALYSEKGTRKRALESMLTAYDRESIIKQLSGD